MTGRFTGRLALIAAVLLRGRPGPRPGPGARRPAAPGVVAAGVSIADVPVGGLTEADAARAVIVQHVAPRRAPLVVTFRGRRLRIDPVKVGYVADVDYAVQGAMLFGRSRPVPPEGVSVPLRERVNRTRLRALLNLRARANDLPPRDARLTFSGVTPGGHQAAHRRRDRRAEGDDPGRVGDPAARPHRLRAALHARASRGDLGGPRRHHRAQQVPAHRVAGGQAPHVPDRRRPAGLPDAHRHLPDREQAGEPHLVPARLTLGGGPRARSRPA